MKIRALLLALVFASSAHAAGWAVPAEVTVTGDAYTLADLVKDAPQRFSRVSYGATPRPGHAAEVEGQWLRRQLSEADAAEVEFPAVVRIARPGRELTRGEVLDALERTVRARYGEDTRTNVEEVGLPGMLPEGETRLEVRLPQGRIARNTTVWIDVWVNGAQKGRAWVRMGLSGDARPGAPAAAPVVTKGDTVRLLVRSGRITVSTSGSALGAAGVGQPVLVENSVSRRVVQGVVRQAGVVEVPMDRAEVN